MNSVKDYKQTLLITWRIREKDLGMPTWSRAMKAADTRGRSECDVAALSPLVIATTTRLRGEDSRCRKHGEVDDSKKKYNNNWCLIFHRFLYPKNAFDGIGNIIIFYIISVHKIHRFTIIIRLWIVTITRVKLFWKYKKGMNIDGKIKKRIPT